ncbi:preprotein translocase subunit YajC [bacterium]|nr:MAG: preprotein translocase subunit YajC [bacterium]
MNLLLLMGDPNQAGGSMQSLVFMGAIFLVFYLFIIRPQTKKQKELQTKISGVKKGDKVVTTGGMLAIVTQVDEDSFLAEIDSNVKARFLKSAIVEVNPNKEPKK